ncbi:MAG: PDZ domain-containing protein [Terriglobales bacterium]|jgi:C-terminal processing protease CtpA/Prc
MSKLIFLVFLCCLPSAFVSAQESGANEYVTGMTAVGAPGAGPSCPLIVWFVEPDTPAAAAGIQPGDLLLAIDGHRGIDAAQARPLLHTKDSKPVTLELEGEHGKYTVTVRRLKESILLKRDGWKVGPDGNVYAEDATDAEMKRVAAIKEPAASDRVFDHHYPKNVELYYPGFEALVLQDRHEIVVWAMEDGGPARKAGAHYGDAIVSVDGVNPLGKSVPDLEALLSSPVPKAMTLVVNRDGVTRTFTFDLIKAADLMRQNKKRFYEGKIIPSVVPDAYLHCFESKH